MAYKQGFWIKGLEGIVDQSIDWVTDTIKVLVVSPDFTFNDTHEFVADIVANEVTNVESTTGYERKTLGTKSISRTPDVSVSGITRSNGTATVTTAADHNLEVGWYVYIAGADQAEYNGRHKVASVTSDTVFTYAVEGTPVTPATGTITMNQKAVILDCATISFVEINTTQKLAKIIPFKEVTGDADSPIIGFGDFKELDTNGSNVDFPVGANGLLRFQSLLDEED